jgi:predicted kinase
MDLARFQTLDVVLICGLQGAGKSHFAKTYFNQGDRKRINRKEIRRLLYEMTNFGDPWKEEYFNDHDEILVNHVERKILEHLLQNKQQVLVDNTNVNVEARSDYLSIAKRLGRTAGVVFLDLPLKVCLERNRSREDRISEGIITNLYARLELPSKAEGFKEVLVVESY